MRKLARTYLSGLSVQTKQVLVIVCTAVICILFSSTTFFFNDLYFARKSFQREIQVLMELIRINSVAPLYFEDPEAGRQALASLKAENDILAAALYTHEGKLFAVYKREDAHGMVFPDRPWDDLQKNLDGRKILVYDVSFKKKNIGYLYFLADLTRINQLIWWYASLSLIITLVSVLIAVFMSTYLRKLVLGPVLHLVRVVKRISRQRDFSIRADSFSNDEIGDLILGFNEMIEKIQKRDRALEKHRRTLEKKVEERTADLVRVNNQLTGLNRDLMAAKKKAEEASSAKSRFLASMSHELRTPLNGILGYTQLFKRYGANLNEEEQQRLHIIHQCGEHLLEMINDILDLSKVEAGKMEIENRAFHLERFIHATVAIAQPRAREKGLEIVTAVDSQLNTYVNGDDQRIRQVLLNLLSNAVKFTDKGQIKLGLTKGQDHFIRFEVTDPGMGIPASDLEVIFQDFAQIGDIRHKSSGTGLGLPICRHLVSLMGGQIKVESRVGKGSRFWFDIPLAQGAKEAGEQDLSPNYEHVIGHKRPGAPEKEVHILIVDDIRDNRMLLADLLSYVGFKIHEAKNGEQAVQACREKCFDLVLMDLVMPVMNGIDATRKILEEANDNPPAVIAVSASSKGDLGEKAIRAGCSGMLYKPVQIEALFRGIEGVLDIEWEMEASVPIPENEPAPLSGKMADELAALSEDGDIQGILEWCQGISGDDQGIRARVSQIQMLARQFKINEIKSLAANKQRRQA